MNGYAQEDETVIVTATRTARTADETLAPVTVITREDIVRLQAQSLQDVLGGTPGLSIGNSGGEGKLSSMFLRGTNSSHVLVLIDGVKVGSAASGTARIEHIPVELIDRIEVVRGPRSSLYGSEAIGGVIQIFTRRDTGTFTPSFSVGAGSDRTAKISTGISANEGNAWMSAHVSHSYTHGYNACSGSSVSFSGCFTEEPDDDAYRNTAYSLSAGWRFGNGAEFDVHSLRSEGKVEYDGTFQNESETVQQVIGTRLRFSPLQSWAVTLAAGQSRDESDNFLNDVFASRFDTTRDSLSWQNDFLVGGGQTISAGIDWQQDRVDGTADYDVDKRNNTGVFAQYQVSFGHNEIQLAARRDDNEQFGIQSTGSVAWGYALNDRLRLTASYGTAFKAPTFDDLYFPFFGNPDLDPETSRSMEIGLAGKERFGRWSVNVFETRIEDLIGFDTAFNIVNIDEARIRGMETVLDGNISELQYSLNLTLLDPENRSDGPNKGNILPRRPETSLRIDIDREVGPFRMGGTFQAAGRRFDNAANTARLGGYGVVDLRAEYNLSRHWLAQGRIVNLFDKDYETVDYFNQSGRAVFFTLRYQP